MIYDVNEKEDVNKWSIARKPFNIHDHDLLGYFSTTLGDIVGGRCCRISDALSGPKGKRANLYGNITIIAEEATPGVLGVLCLKVAAFELITKDWFGQGDHYLLFRRRVEKGGLINLETIHKTEIQPNNSDPEFSPMEIHMGVIGPADLDDELIIEVRSAAVQGCTAITPAWPQIHLPASQVPLENLSLMLFLQVWDWNVGLGWSSANSDTYLGELSTTLRTLLTSTSKKKYSFRKRGTKQPNKNRGYLRILSAAMEEEGTFVQFLSSGAQVSMVIGIDFTASNQIPACPTSLHYLHPGSPLLNPYEMALTHVLDILEKYDDDKKFEAYGFGGRLPSGLVSHCFPLSGSFSHHVCVGVEGVLAAYRMSLAKVALAGPTRFGEVIEAASLSARRVLPGKSANQKYTVLLIVTDGVIEDWNRSVQAIIDASGDPFSIIVVGVGDGNFSRMRELDGDGESLLRHPISGQEVQRDIVQFVCLKDYDDDPALLARKVLAEIPSQFMSYMRYRKIKAPNPRYPWLNLARRAFTKKEQND